MSRRIATALPVLFAGACLALPNSLSAQTKTPAAGATAPTKPAPAAPAVQIPADGAQLEAAWKAEYAKYEAFLEQLDALQDRFVAAKPEEREALREEFGKTIEAFESKTYPRLKLLAEAVYKKNPQNLEAAEMVAEEAFRENRFADSARITDALLAAKTENPDIINIAAISHFAIHDFAKAEQLLAQADKEGNLDPTGGARYVDAAKAYQTYWAEEQKIRAAEAAATPDKLNPQVLLKTTRGEIVVELFENEAPNTVANFISLVEAATYDRTRFHRVIPNFMAQGGDPNSKDDKPADDGQGGPGYAIACECFSPKARKHFQGSLSMAHAGRDTGGSQFFITHLPTPHLNADPANGTGHTVFGRVVKGLDVAVALQRGDEITSATVLRKRNHPYQPQKVDKKD